MTSDNSPERIVRELRSTKVYLVLAVVLLLGVLFLVIDQGTHRQWFRLSEPWRAMPWLALGEACITAFLIGVVYEGVVRRQSEMLLGNLLERGLAAEREAIIGKLTLESVTSPAAVSKLTSDELNLATITVLSARLGEERLARDIVATLFPQAIPNVELTRDYENRVQFLPDHDLPDEPRRYFTARVSVRYRRKLRRAIFTLGVSDDFASVANRLGTPGPLDVVWRSSRNGRYVYDDPRTFRVEYVRVDDEELDIVASDENVVFPSGQQLRARVYTATADSLEKLIGRDVEINYSFVAKVPRLGHLLHFPLMQTCESVRFEFDLGEVGIKRATLIPFFLSASRPLVREERFGNRTVMSASTSSWVLQGGGIVLTWRLSEESDPDYLKGVYGGNGAEGTSEAWQPEATGAE